MGYQMETIVIAHASLLEDRLLASRQSTAAVARNLLERLAALYLTTLPSISD